MLPNLGPKSPFLLNFWTLDSEDRDSTLLQHDGKYLPIYASSYPIKLESSSMREPQTSCIRLSFSFVTLKYCDGLHFM